MAGTRTELQMIKMSEIQSQEVAWLWFPFIPYGKLTIVQGDPGDGKTTLVLNQDFFKSTNCFCDWNIFSFQTGKLSCYEEWLG